jgi:hypothetical protein
MMVGRKIGHTLMSGGKKTDDFFERAFSLVTTPKIRCSCVKCQNLRCFDKVICQNLRCFDKVILMKHLLKSGFTVDYETWVFHSEKYTVVVVEESANDWAGADRMDEMAEAILSAFDMDTKDPPTLELEEFFKVLKASEGGAITWTHESDHARFCDPTHGY